MPEALPENEYRKDYLLERWVIITAKRGKRPQEFVRKHEEKAPEGEGACFFCPGNERLTPPEIDRIGDGRGGWLVRCFPNKFDAVGRDSPKAYGSHEIIIETPRHGVRLAELGAREFGLALQMYRQRTAALLKEKKMEYVLIFKNEGAAAGASLAHTHTQLTALDRVPTLVQEEMDALKKYARAGKKGKGACAYCDVVKKEMKEGARKVYENKDFFCFAPYAPRFGFETWIFPKRHARSLVDLDAGEMAGLADALRQTLRKLEKLLNKPDYNYYIHAAGRKKDDFHFHIEICPRLGLWAGFEFGAGIYLNSMPPEQAAKALRETQA
ncbi:Uncharacterised protein [Candidatus Burarchaeum australiense]|nr:Uncharacterised protein [Candidatus Burarchaeum australiense]